MRIPIGESAFDETQLLKSQAQVKVVGIYDSSIPNGIDLIKIGKGAYQLIKNILKSNR